MIFHRWFLIVFKYLVINLVQIHRDKTVKHLSLKVLIFSLCYLRQFQSLFSFNTAIYYNFSVSLFQTSDYLFLLAIF